jgi:hypothetical protein
MKRNLLIVLLGASILSGCAGNGIVKEGDIQTELDVVPESNIDNIDPSEREKELYGEVVTAKPTPDKVIVGEKGHITIEVVKVKPLYDPILKKTLQVWNVNVINTNNSSRCVGPKWRLMEFEYISYGPTIQLVKGESTLVMGQMMQKGFKIGDVYLTPSPSGYLDDMLVSKPNRYAYPGDECTYLITEDQYTKEEDIIE